jgi:hypothetical protein
MGANGEDMSDRMGALSGAVFLIGLAVLFYLDLFWPGILPLIWLTAAPAILAEEGWWKGLWILAQMGLYLLGLPWLIAADLIWPGIFILFGLSALLAALLPPDRPSHQPDVKLKRKRGQPLYDGELPLSDTEELPLPEWWTGEAEAFPADEDDEATPPLRRSRRR